MSILIQFQGLEVSDTNVERRPTLPVLPPRLGLLTASSKSLAFGTSPASHTFAPTCRSGASQHPRVSRLALTARREPQSIEKAKP